MLHSAEILMITHGFITNAELRHKLSVVGRVNLISVHVQLYLQVYIACLQSAVHTTNTRHVLCHLQLAAQKAPLASHCQIFYKVV